MGEPTVYNHTEMTEITQYNTEEASTFGGGKKYIPVFHGLQQRPGEDNPIQYYEGHVEIGGPSQTPWDIEEFDDEILAQSGRERDIHPDAIAVSPTTGTVKLATPLVTLQLSAAVTPTTSEFPVNWSTSSNKVTVSSTGLVTPVSVGEDIAVTASSGAVSASAVIKVEKVNVNSVTIKQSGETVSSIDILPEATAQLTAHVLPNNAYIKTVTWSSSDEAIATVSNAGLVTAVADGIATITATSTDDNTKSASCEVTVDTPAETPEEPGE